MNRVRTAIVTLAIVFSPAVSTAERGGGFPKANASGYEIGSSRPIIDEKQAAMLARADEIRGLDDPTRDAERRVLYEKIIELDATTPAARKANRTIVGMFLRDADVDRATMRIKAMRATGADEAMIADAMLAVAHHQVMLRRDESALAVCNDIVAAYPESSAAAEAWLTIGEVHERHGRTDLMTVAYSSAADIDPGDTERRWRRGSYPQALAIERLATHYQGLGRYRDAAAWWERWRPIHWCGTCMAGAYTWRTHNLVECRMKAGMFAEVVAELDPLVFPKDIAVIRAVLGVDVSDQLLPYVNAYAQLGRLDELAARAEAWRLKHDGSTADHVAARARGATIVGLIRVAHAAEVGDDATLWRMTNRFDARGQVIPEVTPATAIAAGRLLGERESGRDLLLEKAKGPGFDPTRLFAARLLGQAKGPRIVALARQRLDAMAKEESDTRPSIEARGWFEALLLAGDEEQAAWVRTIADDREHRLRYWAGEALGNRR